MRVEWRALARLSLAEWMEVAWLAKKRRVRARDLRSIRNIIREVKP
jgi:hypothetical protein